MSLKLANGAMEVRRRQVHDAQQGAHARAVARQLCRRHGARELLGARSPPPARRPRCACSRGCCPRAAPRRAAQVRDNGKSFREAHHIVGSFVGELSRKNQTFPGNEEACLAHLKARGVATATLAGVKAVLDPVKIISTYNSRGGTGPEAVKAAQKVYRWVLCCCSLRALPLCAGAID
jgi:hypothetical protein